jgi:hypothetical protein
VRKTSRRVVKLCRWFSLKGRQLPLETEKRSVADFPGRKPVSPLRRRRRFQRYMP